MKINKNHLIFFSSISSNHHKQLHSILSQPGNQLLSSLFTTYRVKLGILSNSRSVLIFWGTHLHFTAPSFPICSQPWIHTETHPSLPLNLIFWDWGHNCLDVRKYQSLTPSHPQAAAIPSISPLFAAIRAKCGSSSGIVPMESQLIIVSYLQQQRDVWERWNSHHFCLIWL